MHATLAAIAADWLRHWPADIRAGDNNAGEFGYADRG